MNIWFENANFSSNSGPNSFAQKLSWEFEQRDIKVNQQPYDASLCFIESARHNVKSIPTFQRLDGIYFNTAQDYKAQNSNILRTYNAAKGVIFQSEFNKNLIFDWFGEHKNYSVIHNGANLQLIDSVPPMPGHHIENYDKVWACASSWRPHKRLQENIRYFREHAGPSDVLFIAGDLQRERVPQDPRIKYLGVLTSQQLICLYKVSAYFVHLAYLDHCPNVVVDARACGSKIVCSSTGGTSEIAGPDAIVIEEEPWDFTPVELYNPPTLDFSLNGEGLHNAEYDMREVSKKYEDFLISAK